MGAIAESARKYLGVRFRHRGRSRAGLDCAGLAWCAYNDLGVVLPDFRLYGRQPHDDGLVRHLTAAFGQPLDTLEPKDDDVVVVRFNVEPHHIAVACGVTYGSTPAINFIHADGHTGRVVEQRMTPDMQRRITHVFRRGL